MMEMAVARYLGAKDSAIKSNNAPALMAFVAARTAAVSHSAGGDGFALSQANIGTASTAQARREESSTRRRSYASASQPPSSAKTQVTTPITMDTDMDATSCIPKVTFA